MKRPASSCLALVAAILGLVALTACDNSPAPSGDASTQDAQKKTEEAKHKDGHDSKKDKDHDSKKDKEHDQHSKKDDEKPAAQAAPKPTPAPDAIVYHLSMHGAAGSDSVIGVTADGQLKGAAVTNIPADQALHLLRGLTPVGDGTILVANAWMKDTRILRFGPIAADGTAPFMAAVMDGGPTNPALFHTYAIAIAPDGSIYCSNQDSITVTRYAGLKSSTPGAPLPLPPSLESRKDIQPATFIPSAKEDKEGLKDVRGIAFGPDELLYVADRKRGDVSAYETQSGKRSHIVASADDGLKQPIQLHFTPDGTTLFISDDGANCVWRVTLATKAVSKFIPPGAGGLNAPSALLVDGDQLLVGSREGKQILAFSLADGTPAAKPFADKLPDNPEFFVRIRPAGK